MKQIYTSTELDDALICQALLREHGIESILENERSAFLLIEMPTCAIPLVLTVGDDQAEAAQEVLEASRARRLEEDQPASEPPSPESDGLQQIVSDGRRSRRRRWWIILIWMVAIPGFVESLSTLPMLDGGWKILFGAATPLGVVTIAAVLLAWRHGSKVPRNP